MRVAAGMLVAAIVMTVSPSLAQDTRGPPPYPQEECPQGREIRAKNQYPASMTDCQVLDANTASLNQPKRPSVKAMTSPTTQGPSYDCSKAAKSVERLICSDKQLGELEWLVAGAFKRALDNQADKTSLIAQQRQFNIARNDCAKEAQSEVHSCVQQLLGSRAMYLSTLWKKETSPAAPVDLIPATVPQDQSSHPQPTAFADTLKPAAGSKSAEDLVILVAFLEVYFLPSLTAYSRGHHNRVAIAALNLFLGWSFLGWVAAFVWACTRTGAQGSMPQVDVLAARREPRI
jgi:hypothetical protein